MVMAKLTVPVGALAQLNLGEIPVLSQVYNFGNEPLLLNAELLAVKAWVVEVGVTVSVAVELFLQDENNIMVTSKIVKQRSLVFMLYFNDRCVKRKIPSVRFCFL